MIHSLPGYLSHDNQAESARSNIKQSSPWLDICVLHQNIGADQSMNDDALKTNLDLIDEIRVTAHCRELAAKQLLAAKYNRKVRPRAFNRGNLVLRRANIGNKNAKDGKLAANWEGP